MLSQQCRSKTFSYPLRTVQTKGRNLILLLSEILCPMSLIPFFVTSRFVVTFRFRACAEIVNKEHRLLFLDVNVFCDGRRCVWEELAGLFFACFRWWEMESRNMSGRFNGMNVNAEGTDRNFASITPVSGKILLVIHSHSIHSISFIWPKLNCVCSNVKDLICFLHCLKFLCV